jgi:uncharacterized cupin superfamily protein
MGALRAQRIMGEKTMHSYKQSANQTGLEVWPDLEEKGIEVLEGNPKPSGRVDWGTAGGPLTAGTFECTPGKFRLTYPFSELSTILRGRLTVTDGEGNQETFGPGDSFFMAQGEDATWEIHETVRKTFFLHIAAG